MSRDENESTQPNHQRAPDNRAGQPQSPQLDDSDVEGVYANFARISGTPEEVVLDFALNTAPAGSVPEVLKLNQRVVLNYYTAKRLLGALHMAVQRHEATFGAIETDIRKRADFEDRSNQA